MKKLVIMLLFAAVSSAGAENAATPYPERAEAAELIDRLQTEHGLEREWVRARLAAARHQPQIIEAMRRPAEKTLAWHEYRKIFLKPDRIADGAAFVRRYADIFDQAEARYGVPANLIAAIIGVETRYGEHLGDDRVLDALATLGFDYPERADFFRRELGEFLVLAHEENIDADSAVGSYAGAMGLPQFIPSSYRAYAVDFNDNGQRDLWHEPADVIGSVASYLAEHGWERGADVILRARTEGDPSLERSRREPRYRYRELAANGVVVSEAPDNDTRVGLVELEGEDGPEFWVGLNNFFVITTYNHSRLYAMAVHQLSQAIADRVDADGNTTEQ